MMNPLDRLSMVQSQIDALRAELPSLVAEARSQGKSWAAIGECLGVSPQAAHQRFGPRPNTIDGVPLSDPMFDAIFDRPKD